MKLALAILALALPLSAQTKAPELSTTEKAAIQFLLDHQAKNNELRASLEAAQKDVNNLASEVQAEAAKSHPGYHLSLNPIALVKDEVKK